MGKRTAAEDEAVTATADVGENDSSEEVTDTPSWYVYIGPSVRGVVHYGHIFHSDYEAAYTSLGKLYQKYPDVRGLIVGGNTLSASIKALKTEGTALNLLSKQITKILAK